MVTKLPFRVGRAKHCDLVLEVTHLDNFINNVSKEHFNLSKDSNNVLYLSDLSKNGTYINGKKVGKGLKVPLNDGGNIAVGHVNFCCKFNNLLFLSPAFL